MTVERDLVFVSYSHDDAAWAQAFTEILKPLVRSKRLRMWVDTTNIRVGERWHPEIERGIAGSDLALLLVSRSYLASDYIMETELPALVAAGVRLAPALVGDCLWHHVPELAVVQWLHDPGQDGALGRFADNPGERDRRLVQICERLLPLLPAVSAAPPIASTVPQVRAAAVPEGPTAGALSGVPALPPAYVVRAELAGLVAAVAAEVDALGLVGPAVGVHGQGGIGKSVLVAALARHEGVRRRFPDGVFWVPVGEHADVLALQLDLLARVGAGPSTARTVAEATAELRSIMAEKRVLLVVDDVWTAGAAHAFRVTGPHGRVVYTSRDAALVAAVGAAARAVEVLSSAAASELAAGVLGGVVPPRQADAVFAAVGHTPLGVALVAAAVAGGRGWAELAAELARDVYGDHPSANAFKAMQAAVGALPADLTEALLGLAMFPAGTGVPIAAVARLWAHTRAATPVQTAADLDRLAVAGVLQRDGDTIGFHDLQHDYLVLHAPPLAGLHAALVAAYRALLPPEPSPWWRLPDGEPYVFDHLVTHLTRAGDRVAVAAAVTDPAYLARRITAGGVHGAEADLAAAAALLPDDPAIAWLRGWLGRHAHLLAPAEAAAQLVPTTLRAWLAADPDTGRRGVDPGRLEPLLTRPRLDVRWGLVPRPVPLVRVVQADVELVSAAWSPDGALLATGCRDGAVLLWDTSAWEQVNRLDGHVAEVHVLAWASTGALASADPSGRVVRWDPVTLAMTPLPEWLPDVRALVWSPDGARLFAVCAAEGRVRVHDAEGGAPIWSGGGGDHDMVVTWALGDTALAVAGVGDVAVVDLGSGARRAVVSTANRMVSQLAWLAEGSRLAMITSDEVLVWDPAAGDAPSSVFRVPGPAVMTWSPDGARLALVGYGEPTVQIIDPVEQVQRTALTGHGRAPADLAWRSDRLAVVAGGRAHIWDVTAAERRGPATDDAATHMACSADGSVAAVVMGTGTAVWLHDLRTGDRHAAVSVAVGVGAITLSSDGRWLAIGSRTGLVKVLRTAAPEDRALREWDVGYVSALCWSPNRPLLAVGGSDGFVRLWDVVEDQVYATFERQDGGITGLAWSPSGDRLAVTAQTDPAVTFWAPDTGRRLGTVPPDVVGPVAWSTDGSRVAAGRRDAAVLVWDPATGAVLATLTGHASRVTGIAWSGDGDRLVTADDEGLLIVRSLSDPGYGARMRLEPVRGVARTNAGIAVASDTGVVVFDVR